MKNRVAIAMFLLACLPVAAKGDLIATAGGYTIGPLGEKQAEVKFRGGDPSIIAIDSIQSGDSPLYPLNPVHLEASLLGSGSATYGALAASLQAQARNQATIPNILEPSVFGILRMSFTDSGVIVSDTLPFGTAVNITFDMSLASAFVATGRQADPTHNGGSADFDAKVTDVNTGAFVSAFVGNGSGGTTPGLVVQTLHADVGDVIDLSGKLVLGVEARSLNDSDTGGDVLHTTSILASHTGTLTYLPQEHVQLISDSGHDYSVVAAPAPTPEPSTLSLAALGIAAMIVRRRTRRVHR
jgi:hypothetical protein